MKKFIHTISMLIYFKDIITIELTTNKYLFLRVSLSDDSKSFKKTQRALIFKKA